MVTGRGERVSNLIAAKVRQERITKGGRVELSVSFPENHTMTWLDTLCLTLNCFADVLF